MPARYGPPPLDVELLRRFHAVARAGGFTAAAKHLHIAQPAVSRSIRALEESLGRRLIERSSRRFSLTPPGEKLLAECAAVFDRVDAIRSVLADDEVDVRGALRIGAAEPVAARLLPDAIAALLTRHPDLHPFVVVGPTSELVSRVASGDLDLALTFHRARIAHAVAQRTLARFRFDIVVAAGRVDDPATNTSFLGSREVEDERERSFPALTAWRARWPGARIRASTNSLTAHIALVRAGAGVSIVPTFAVHDELRAGHLVRAPGAPSFAFGLYAVTRRGPGSDAARAFLTVLEASLAYAPGRA
jgi:DNA-binding transcriptional LysR family regulator